MDPVNLLQVCGDVFVKDCAQASPFGPAGGSDANERILCNLVLILTGTTGKALATVLFVAACLARPFRRIPWSRASTLMGYCLAVCTVSLMAARFIANPPYEGRRLAALALLGVAALGVFGFFALLLRRVPWISVIVPVCILLAFGAASIIVSLGGAQACAIDVIIGAGP